jgi:hypothetical protein
MPSAASRLVRAAAVLALLPSIACGQAGPVPAASSPSINLLDSGIGRECTVQGRLVDRAGQPVQGVAVWFVPYGATFAAFGVHYDIDEVPQIHHELRARLPHVTSDADGRFDLPGRIVSDPGLGWFPGGNDPLIVIDGAGYALRGVRVSGLADSGRVDVGTCVLCPDATLRGRAVDLEGRPLSGVRIGVHMLENHAPDGPDQPKRPDADASDAWRDQETELDGRFEIRQLWDCPIYLNLWSSQRLPRMFEDLQPVAGESTSLGDVSLEPGLFLDGQVRDEAGSPLAGANVLVTRPIDWPSWKGAQGIDGEIAETDDDFREIYGGATTDESGRFHVGGLELANCWLYVSAEGRTTERVIDLVPNQASLAVTLMPAGSPSVPLRPAQDPSTWTADVRIQPVPMGSSFEPTKGSVHGHLMFPGGVPGRPWIKLRLTSTESGKSIETPLEKDGSFRFEGAAPGHYELQVPTSLPGSTRQAPAETTLTREFELPAGADAKIEIVFVRKPDTR